jgi:hypothetical protein
MLILSNAKASERAKIVIEIILQFYLNFFFPTRLKNIIMREKERRLGAHI